MGTKPRAKELVESFREGKPLLFRHLLQIGKEVIVDSHGGSHSVIIASLSFGSKETPDFQGESSTIVTGPSFSIDTRIFAPNSPVWTGTPSNARRLQKSS